jgi:hypothetical protein
MTVFWLVDERCGRDDGVLVGRDDGVWLVEITDLGERCALVEMIDFGFQVISFPQRMKMHS